MPRALTGFLVILASWVLVGMGSLGGTPEGELPKTTENVKAQVVDRSGVATELSRFSFDGKLFLKGKRGQGDMNVPFRDTREIVFGAASGSNVAATVLLASGGNEQLNVDKSTLFFGDTGHGVFRILAGDVSRVVFHK